MTTPLTADKIKEMLARIKARQTSSADPAKVDALVDKINEEKPSIISFHKAGISYEAQTTEEGQEAVQDFLQEITSKDTPGKADGKAEEQKEPKEKQHTTGVAANVTLNQKQLEFSTLLSSGRDLCFIGAAGTGKTTATGRAIKSLIQEDKLPPLGVSTKVLHAHVPGVLICSFTRKAVNNIKRALPDELKLHALTLHKVLEFQPVFYDIIDDKSGDSKKTMSFEPARNAVNPLPSNLRLAIFEESSMIGTDLYNQWKAATPHFPQEVFIGDIQQLPPVFGSAILGFKMALLPIVELTEVYRQALKSPIIRLAHSILSGDHYRFDKSIKTRKELHPYTKREVTKKFCPSLEAYNQDDEDGILKFQIWQKNLDAENACNAIIAQFIAWYKEGYYKPFDDIIMCPFGISENKKGDAVFGTKRINNGIMEYLSKERGAVVYEVIAGYNKHYYAIGDRVLYDKEDAVIINIMRNTAYMGRTVSPPSVDLSREGYYNKPLSEEEQAKAAFEESVLTSNALDELLDDFSVDMSEEPVDRVNAASHAITIKFSYSDEVLELRQAAEINNLMGGHALTIHKLQGSESETCFLVLHKSHAVMVQRELLYTAVTRASKKLHIICEEDSFFNGVKSQKVKGNTLAEKIEFFKGKGKYVEMEEEMRILRLQKDSYHIATLK